ncbi:MAG: dienelactone hydrolase family protein [Parvibaculum sp.]|uniref:alpha/beta hydrolase n=1 Tax=Parvibaculum sp. TaxID=2024848 RepID=UPI00284C5390|nr:dienelactone hydrolase family protein [Parvibaculum sp.]MDR3500155.1 dienelactone hydrolase family protein [Parvibaculum sp.]
MTDSRSVQEVTEPVYPPLEMPSDVHRRAVSIWRDGLALDGDIYRPDALDESAKCPAVVLCHGWGGSKLTAERYAALFAASGMIALTFTQATWFGSGSRLVLAEEPPQADEKGEGTTRIRFIWDIVDPVDWLGNFEAAVDYLEGEPNVDHERIGAWGTSFGGGVAMHVAANDGRIKALSVQVAWVAPLKGERLAQARRRAVQAARGEVDPFAQTSDTAPGMPGLANLARFAQYDVLGQLDRLRVPTLILDAENEEFFPIRENGGAAFAILAARPGQIIEHHVIPGIDHYGIYFGGYDQSSRFACEWFKRHLAASAVMND